MPNINVSKVLFEASKCIGLQMMKKHIRFFVLYFLFNLLYKIHRQKEMITNSVISFLSKVKENLSGLMEAIRLLVLFFYDKHFVIGGVTKCP